MLRRSSFLAICLICTVSNDLQTPVKAKRLLPITHAINPEIWNEIFLEPTESIKKNGYPAENHTVETKDGYLLTVHRIPNDSSVAIPILLMHGLGSSSEQYFDSQEYSPAFHLFNAGFDVWIGNFRGGPFTGHKQYTKHDKKFWSFCIDDMVDYDITAMIDYVLEKTAKNRLFYAAQSLGTMVATNLFAYTQSYNTKVVGYMAITPAASGNYVTGPLTKLLTKAEHILKLLAIAGQVQFGQTSPFLLDFVLIPCLLPKLYWLCELQFSLMAGWDPYVHNQTRLPIYLVHGSYGSSIKLYKQLLQTFHMKSSHRYDYGEKENLEIYNSTTPPMYNISNVAIPTVIFYNANDGMAGPIDIELLARQLPNLIAKELNPWPLANHGDSMYSLKCKERLYGKLIQHAYAIWNKMK